LALSRFNVGEGVHDDDGTRRCVEHGGAPRIGGGAGEILVTSAAAGAAGLDENLERRTLELKGKQDVVDVVSVTVRPAVTAG
jgi:hypothetical protein